MGLVGVNAVLNDAVLYYSFDDGSSNYNVFGATGSSDGMSFDGSNDYLKIPTSLNIAGTNLFSINLWVYKDSGSGDVYFDSRDGSDVNFIFLDDNGGAGLRAVVGNSGNIVYNVDLTSGFNFVTLIKKSSATNGVEMYVNGILVATGTDTTSLDSNMGLTIASRFDQTTGAFYDGKIKDVNIYDRALSTGEITQLYNNEDVTSGRVFNAPLTSLNDISYNGNDGTGENGVLSTTSGKLENAFDFDGSNDYVTKSSISLVGNTFTFNHWINLDTTAPGSQIISSLAPSSGNINYIQLETANDELRLLVGNSAGTIIKDYRTTSLNLATSTWHFISYSWDGTNLKIYSNGIEITALNKVTDSAGSLTSTTRSIYLGTQRSLSGFMNGKLDEFALYDRALSLSEIQELYNSGDGYNPYAFAQAITFNNPQQDQVLNSTSFLLNVSFAEVTNATYILNNGSETFICNDCLSSDSLNLVGVEGVNNLTILTNTTGTLFNQSINFTIDTTNPTLSVNLPTEINSYNINFSQYINYSDNVGVLSCIVSISGENQSNCNETSYNFSTSGNKTINVTLTDLAGNSVSDNNNLLLVNPFAYLYFEDTSNNPINTSYSLNGVSFSNPAQIPYYNSIINIGENSLEFEALGYAITNISFNLSDNAPYFNQTYEIQNSKIVLKVFDVTTGDLVSEAIEYTLISTSYSGNFTGGQINISDVAFYEGQYQIVLESLNYETESVFFTYNNKEELQINAYMIPTTTTNLGVLNVKVETSIDVIAGQLVNLLAWDSSASAFITIGQSKTDSNGDAFFNIELGNRVYKVTATRQGETRSSPEQVIRVSGTIVYLNFGTPLEQYPTQTFGDVSFSLTNTTYNSTHDLITFTFADENNLVTKACIEINRLRGSYSTQISENCVNSASGQILVITSRDNEFVKEVLAVAYSGNDFQKLGNILYKSNLNIEDSLGDLSKWFVLIMILAVMALGIYLQNIPTLTIGTIITSWVVYSIFSNTMSYTIPLLITIIMILVLYGTFKKRF
jgi:hypothetical protein